MELYLIRHGETIWNNAGRIQGHSDITLNDNGRELASLTGKALEDVHFDKIFSSPLVRAYETAKLIRGNHNTEIQITENLKEIGFGNLEGVNYSEQMNNPQSPIYTFFKNPEAYIPSDGGETIEGLSLRAKEFLENEIIPLEDTCSRILAVAHGAMNKAIMSYIRKLEVKDFWSGKFHNNCAVTIIDINNSNMTIIKEGIVVTDCD